ncbi:TPA: hypothetical protein JG804_004443 [Vibrio parahaemolyticus]|uniref:hypothetical protein n=3 Tax=Vibrio parahaemolyticus TaxID=670 RepID=UPI000A389450|nr:hypothetical protein [Vibrio parahaemolyticus]MCC4210946.1 hypothetical protein [Vibrio parahaemolyticus]MDF4628372.1 hypothetical protein [Vibrio parahaemolyticus]OUJ37966.1 hypothetical protein BTZ05_24270 [Vibrio parahaemolyticus]UPR07829.1 hypothetical protein H9K48_06250 [Vibrio parahaemolyticus]HAV1379305.1 hypothetical protein [Vibrio parahaemolyticus]
MDKDQLNWNRYAMHIDLYKFYFDLIIKINIFYYGITGAILSFYLSSNANNTHLEYALLLPIFFGICFTMLCIVGDRLLVFSQADIDNLARNMNLEIAVETSSLNYLMRTSAVIAGLSSLVILWMFCSTTI